MDDEVQGSEEVNDDLSLEEVLSRAFDEASNEEISDSDIQTDGEVQEEATEVLAEDPDQVKQEVESEEQKSDAVQTEIPDETRQYIETLEQERTVSEAFRSIVDPHFEFIEAIGSNPFEHVSQLLDLSRALHTGDDDSRAAILADLFEGFGVSVEAMEKALNDKILAPKPDPIQQKMIEKLERLERNQVQQAPKPQQAPAPDQKMIAQVQEFASKNEFFETVKQDMGILIQSGRASNLQEAYKMACRMNDQVQKTIRERNTSAAKAAKPKLSGSKPKAPVSSGDDLRSILAKAYDESE